MCQGACMLCVLPCLHNTRSEGCACLLRLRGESVGMGCSLFCAAQCYDQPAFVVLGCLLGRYACVCAVLCCPVCLHVCCTFFALPLQRSCKGLMFYRPAQRTSVVPYKYTDRMAGKCQADVATPDAVLAGYKQAGRAPLQSKTHTEQWTSTTLNCGRACSWQCGACKGLGSQGRVSLPNSSR